MSNLLHAWDRRRGGNRQKQTAQLFRSRQHRVPAASNEVQLLPDRLNPAADCAFIRRITLGGVRDEPFLHFHHEIALPCRKAIGVNTFENSNLEAIPVILQGCAWPHAPGAADAVILFETIDFLGRDHDVGRSQPHAACRFGDRLPGIIRR